MPQRITRQTVCLLEALLSEPAREWYGFELMERASLRSGTVYPLLHRLQADGWLTSFREKIDPSEEGRPRRRLYRLTAEGERSAQALVTLRTSRTAAPRGSRPAFRPRGAEA
jgi:DNA-binding PadR family transcriptional regulator